MLTLDQILEGNATLTQAEARLRHAMQRSPFIQRLLTGDANLLPDILQNMQQPWTGQAMRDSLAAQDIADEAALKRALRKLRQQVMLRIIVRDLNGLADLQEVMQVTSQLAEVTLQFALSYLTASLEVLYGTPQGENGSRQQLIVVGMGKLGGSELNVSSDIDLIFAFEEDGETGTGISNVDFFMRLSKKLIAAIDEVTEDGFVFRVDMRLRPYGSEGPLACSFAMLEEYYQNQGREWERYAWIKGRVVAGPEHGLLKLLKPFVFRKYLDYGAFASMRDLKVQIQRDVDRRQAGPAYSRRTEGKAELNDNIKLGRGGIREIEFIAQVFQLIRGGQDASLQIRPTLSVLALLETKALLPKTTVQELTTAYIFLRNLEHRLQYMEDAQTQELPVTQDGRARLALAMDYPDWAALSNVLEQHRGHVERHFREVFNEPAQGADKPLNDPSVEVWQGTLAADAAQSHLAALGYTDSTETLRRMESLREGKYRQLPDLSRHRFDALMPVVVKLAGQEKHPETTLMRVSDLLDNICRRASYLALLTEYPDSLTLLVKLAGASPWLMQYLAQHPVLLDELLDTRNLYAEPDFVAMRDELERRLAEVPGDVERQMDIMRDFKHAATFRFAAKDVIGELALETLSDYLSALADLILQATIDSVWPALRGKHRDVPKFAVVGYGKLGGRELGYASDLDIIFLYEDDAPDAGEIYARLGQRINNWLSSLTSAGMLYETDLQLRPDGASGLLVSSFEAFREYQLSKAWVWEHQALTRARFCAGDSQIGASFEQLRIEILCQPRAPEKLRAEVVAMRQKMYGGHPNNSELFDLKHDNGGIVDVEFLVQYLILAYAHQYPQLAQNLGNIALLQMLGELGLLELAKAESVAAAYREYRRMQHAIRLQGETRARIAHAEVAAYADEVQALWIEVFGEPWHTSVAGAATAGLQPPS
jgi:[glutamine synthetase] adenylyltransferase / [glutamine synthetase]-adenylyl-L-tyrosine phosphorylase